MKFKNWGAACNRVRLILSNIYTSLSVCPVSKSYMRGVIGFETKGKAVIVLFQMLRIK